MNVIDYLVVGSGCAGSMAAQTLVDSGVKVTMVDVGITDPSKGSLVPENDFLTIRRNDPDQFKYLLGENAEGAAWGRVSKGAQITPPRQYMFDKIDDLIPFESENFSPMESLAYGGLGNGWGLQCWEFSSNDLKRVGLDSVRMGKAYATISRRIGISATKDSASPYTIGTLKEFQPSPRMDRNHALIYKKYLANEMSFTKRGFYMGRTPLALLTKNLGNREAYQYYDMDYYADLNHSAWRPWMTVDSLREQPNFTYLSSLLVRKFSEKKGIVTVECINTETNKLVKLHCRKLILSAGTLGTARILLRSVGKPETKLPLLSNPHAYIPCIQPAMLSKGPEEKKLGFGQLSLFIDKPENGDMSVASTYSYQSLMMFRLVRQMPLGFAAARAILQHLMPGMIIMIAQHADSPSKDKYLQLVKNSSSITGDKLRANYVQSQEEQRLDDLHEKQYISAMRKLNVYALKRVHVEHGSAVHYAGTIPFSNSDSEYTLSQNGRLHGTCNVYIADSSGFNFLPAKGLTFSLMANAHMTAENVLKNE